MREIAPDVWHIPLSPRDGVNAYLLGDVLVDAGAAPMAGGLLGKLEGREVSAHTITHAHYDHVGGSKKVIDRLGVPMWAPAGDAEAVESGRPVLKSFPGSGLMAPVSGWSKVPVDRRLEEGDEVAGFVVLDTPGHSPGEVSFWRESDRVLVCGDVFFNIDFRTLRTGLREPIKLFTVDIPRNRESMRRLADLEPETVLVGHGPPVRDAAAKVRSFVDRKLG
jgi:glyoxylase-like metal-dependent hydrolase (beta-lactamase superfamily II)